MKGETLSTLAVALALTLVAGAVYSVFLIGGDRLFILAIVLIGGLVIAGIIAAAALPIRAWRRRDPTGEIHHYRDGTKTVVREVRTIDGRQPLPPEVKLLQLPAPQGASAFPELLRAAYQAGALADRRAGDPSEDEAHEVDPSDPAGWGGHIRT